VEEALVVAAVPAALVEARQAVAARLHALERGHSLDLVLVASLSLGVHALLEGRAACRGSCGPGTDGRAGHLDEMAQRVAHVVAALLDDCTSRPFLK